jgi:hypothetical protein
VITVTLNALFRTAALQTPYRSLPANTHDHATVSAQTELEGRFASASLVYGR